jgi:hypothetical protein
MNATENNRVVEFRQFKQRIRGSTDELVVGLDIDKRKHHAFFGNGNGKTIVCNAGYGKRECTLFS